MKLRIKSLLNQIRDLRVINVQLRHELDLRRSESREMRNLTVELIKENFKLRSTALQNQKEAA